MKTDRELLELAALSYGFELGEWDSRNLRWWDKDGMDTFDPLQDDGDAQRLRNKLRMDVFYTDQGVNVAHDDVLLAFEPWGAHDLATERHAITRAAAQMQLNKEQSNGK